MKAPASPVRGDILFQISKCKTAHRKYAAPDGAWFLPNAGFYKYGGPNGPFSVLIRLEEKKN
jgi:hypothetical protein